MLVASRTRELNMKPSQVVARLRQIANQIEIRPDKRLAMEQLRQITAAMADPAVTDEESEEASGAGDETGT